MLNYAHIQRPNIDRLREKQAFTFFFQIIIALPPPSIVILIENKVGFVLMYI